MLWPCSSAPSLGWGLQGWPQDSASKSALASVESSELSINHSSLSRHLPACLFPRYRGLPWPLFLGPYQLQTGAPGG